MEIVLPPRLEEYVQSRVRSGRYSDPADVVRDALRRMQEAEPPEDVASLAGMVREAVGLASEAQRDVLSVVQTLDVTADWRRELIGQAGAAATSVLDVVRKVPVARDVERLVRGSVEQLTATAERGERESRQMRQGLEATARALGLLLTVLEKVNGATAQVGRSLPS